MPNEKPSSNDNSNVPTNDNSFCDISEFAVNSDFLSVECKSTGNIDADNEECKNNVSSTLQAEIEKVDPLSPEEVRWFYWTKKNQLKPMVGYDSIRLENEWRLFYYEFCTPDSVKRISIRGGMYEADVIQKLCFPIYWSNSDCDPTKPDGDIIVRGSWFFEFNWQPLDEVLADRIEKEHLERWKGIDLKEIKTASHDGVMHSVQLDGCHVDWNSVNDVLFYKDATTHRAFRNIVQKFGVSKITSGGYRLHRGFNSLSVIYDNHLPVSHLIFVVHGIGAKSDKRKVVRNTADFRCVCRRVKPTNFTERVEFIPVEWRSKVQLDGDIVESITPKKSQTIRSFVNNTAMDVLYYASPLYRNDIVGGLRNELNRIYKEFMERNPTFDGKVCVLAHSLGSVIIHDILTGWIPQCDTESLHKESSDPRLSQLTFHVDYLFCVGSPLGMFLCLRGHQMSSRRSGVQDDIIPSSTCRKIFNVFHPADPVAYRLEPLILPHYKNVPSVQIASYHTIMKAQGVRLSISPCPGVSSYKDDSTGVDDDVNDDECCSSDLNETAEIEDQLPQRKPSYLRTMSIAVAGSAARLGRGIWHRTRKNPTDAEDEEGQSDVSRRESDVEKEGSPSTTETDLAELLERIDYELPEGFTESKLGYASLTSHTSYWHNQDLAMFLMSQLLSQEARL